MIAIFYFLGNALIHGGIRLSSSHLRRIRLSEHKS